MIFFCSVHTSRQFSFVKWTLLRVVELFVYIWWQSFLEVMKISKVWKELLSYQLSLSIFYRVALLLLMVPLLPGILIIKKQIASGSLILTVTNSFQVSDQRFFFVTFWWQATFSKQATASLCCITGMEQNCSATAATDVLISWTCMNGVFFPRLWKVWLGFSLTTTTNDETISSHTAALLLLMDPKSNQLLQIWSSPPPSHIGDAKQ